MVDTDEIVKSTLICSTFACQPECFGLQSDSRMPKRSVVKLNDIWIAAKRARGEEKSLN